MYDRDLLRSSRYLTYPCPTVEVRIITSPSPPRLFNEFCALRIYLSAYRACALMIVQDFLDSPQSLPFTGIIYIPRVLDCSALTVSNFSMSKTMIGQFI
jgi:hypothetical protein